MEVVSIAFQKSIQRPRRSQSPKRVGSGPLGPPISRPAAGVRSEESEGRGEEATFLVLSWVGRVSILRMRLLYTGVSRFSLPVRTTAVDSNAAALIRRSEQARTRAKGPACLNETVLELRGPDTLAFLESLSTTSLASIPVGGWRCAAFANAQGRLVAWGRLVSCGENFLLAVPGEGTGALLAAHFARHRLRSRLTIETRDDLTVAGNPEGSSWNPAAIAGTVGRDPTEESWRLEPSSVVIRGGRKGTMTSDSDADRAWRLRELAAGIVRLPSSLTGTFTIPALGPFVVSLVALDKGCFPGQEVVRKMLRLGHGKRVLAWAESDVTFEAGATLVDETERERGRVLGSIADEGRFLVQLVVQLEGGSEPQELHAPDRASVCRIRGLMPPVGAGG